MEQIFGMFLIWVVFFIAMTSLAVASGKIHPVILGASIASVVMTILIIIGVAICFLVGEWHFTWPPWA